MQSVDMKESKRQDLSMMRKLYESSVQKNYKERFVTDNSVSDYQYDETDHSDGVVDDEQLIFNESSKNKSKQNRTDIKRFIAEVERYGVSDRAAAALYNTALGCIYT